MFYRSYTPAPPLGDFIGRFWLCSDAPPDPRERILPSGTIELVVNLRDDEIRIYQYRRRHRPLPWVTDRGISVSRLAR
jgi:hypothetical protein